MARHLANNAQTTTFALGLALLCVTSLRLWQLPQAGPPDYDSAHNWQLVQALAVGHFDKLFINGSPGFRLLFVPLAWLKADFYWCQILNALLGVAAVGWFSHFVIAETSDRKWAAWEVASLVLLSGMSILLTFSGRDFTNGSASLLACVGLMQAYFGRLRGDGAAGLVRSAKWLALGLCLSYKLLLIIPILAVLEWWRADKAAWRGGTIWQMMSWLALPYVVLGAMGVVLAGLPWYRWLGVYVRLVVPAAANSAGRSATVQPDFGYYFRYLLDFESPILLVGLVAAAGLVLMRERLHRGQPLSLLAFLVVWNCCLLAGMSLLIKAPRGLLFAYLPLTALAVLAGRQLLPAAGRAVVLAAAISWNGYLLWGAIYAYPPTNLPQVAAWLRTHHATRIASTVELRLAPYLDSTQTLTVITDEKQLTGLRQQGYDYVLLGAYWRVTNIQHFDSLRQQPAQATWPELWLAAPLLFLEHSEFTGLGYEATLQASRAAMPEAGQAMRLYKIK